MQWNGFWCDFLEQKTVIDGRLEYAHERLRKARRGLSSLVNKNLLFTYLDSTIATEGLLPRTTTGSRVG